MIGPEWSGEDGKKKPTRARDRSGRKRVIFVTGSRAEFGLLVPVIDGAMALAELDVMVVAAGSHLVSPALTFRDVKKKYEVADSIPMQVAGRVGRLEDVQSLGRGIARFGRSFELLEPDWVVVLGDRIEAFAAATAASVGGIPVAHLHGGDVAEGVADEAMRHAITKLAHLHLAASEDAARRIRMMGEPAARIVVTGSPAIDGLGAVEPMSDQDAAELGDPEAILMLHGTGRTDEQEEATADATLQALEGRRVLWLAPNLDAGRHGIVRAMNSAGPRALVREHLVRDRFLSLLARLAKRGGVMVGNSSAALIECQALGLPAVNIGPRQGGRERGSGVVDASGESVEAIRAALERAMALDRSTITHPFGDGSAGERAAAAIARVDLTDPSLVRKRSDFSDAR